MAAPRVLVVEDHAILRETLSFALRAGGMDVQLADDLAPDAVLKVAEAFRPDVVLLDFYLDAGDSLPMIAPLAALGTTVLMLTSSTDRRLLGECLEAGAGGVVVKEEALETLVDVIRRAHEGERVLPVTLREELLDAARAGRAADRTRSEPFDKLTLRERQVLLCLLEGKSAEEIARQEYVSLATVRSQIRQVLLKLGVNSQLAAVALARKADWTG